jgi:hypothetical protein
MGRAGWASGWGRNTTGYDRPMEDQEPLTAAPDDIEVKVTAVAHHEAGHLVIAAAMELPLRAEGLSIDPVGKGLACYCKQPDGTDASRKRVVVATFAGWYAQKRFCEQRSIAFEQGPYLASTCDWWEARDVLCAMSKEYLSERDYFVAHELLARRSEALVEKHWFVIETLANALLGKTWEPLKPLKGGGQWSEQATAKYVVGEEVVSILTGCGIQPHCVSEC